MFGYKKKTRVVAISLLIFTMAFASACSSNNEAGKQSTPTSSAENSGTGGESSVEPDNAEPSAKYDPKIVVTAVRGLDQTIKFHTGESIDNNDWSRAYEDELGIKVNYLWTADGSQYDTKLNLAIASGDLPDIIPVNQFTLQRLIDADLVADLTDVFEKYATPKTKEVLNSDDGYALKDATFKGKLMALPNIIGGVESGDVIFIREDWRKKLNLPEPHTMDDVLRISEAFTKQDPDGNGKPDTYGLALSKELLNGITGLMGLFNGYHAYPNNWVEDESGKLVYGSTRPEVKNALQTLQNMFKSGQIDPEFAVKSSEKASELTVSGKVGMHYSQWWIPYIPLNKSVETDPKAEWKAYPIVSADDKTAYAVGGRSAYTFYAVNKKSQHPEAAIKLLNLYNEKWGKAENSEKFFFGTDINKADYALLMSTPSGKNIKTQQAIKQALETKDTSILKQVGESEIDYANVKKYLDGDHSLQLWSKYMVYGPEGSLGVLAKYIEENKYVFDKFTGPSTPTMLEKNAMLNDLQNQMFTKIIMGAASADEFDSFVDQWNKLGGDKITQEVNDWFASR